MTDLRKAAEMALEVLETTWGDGHEDTLKQWEETIQVLRQALAQPEREWVGLTDEEVMEIAFNFDVPSLVVRTAEAKLREKNCDS